MEKKSKIKSLRLARDLIPKGFYGCVKKPCGGKKRNLPIGEKVALLGQTILETLELDKIKRHAKGL